MVRFLSIIIFRVFFRMKVEEAEFIPLDAPFIVVANHDSLLDGFVLVSAISRRINFLSAAHLFEISFVGWFLAKMGAIPVRKKGQNFGSLKKALEVLNRNGVLGIFPEGGINDNNIYSGATYLAVKSGVPILPVAILGAHKALPPGKKWPRLTPIKVKIGRLVSTSRKERLTHKYLEEETKLLKQILISLRDDKGFC